MNRPSGFSTRWNSRKHLARVSRLRLRFRVAKDMVITSKALSGKGSVRASARTKSIPCESFLYMPVLSIWEVKSAATTPASPAQRFKYTAVSPVPVHTSSNLAPSPEHREAAILAVLRRKTMSRPRVRTWFTSSYVPVTSEKTFWMPLDMSVTEPARLAAQGSTRQGQSQTQPSYSTVQDGLQYHEETRRFLYTFLWSCPLTCCLSSKNESQFLPCLPCSSWPRRWPGANNKAQVRVPRPSRWMAGALWTSCRPC